MKVTIYWRNRKPEFVNAIREKFGIYGETSVNYETVADIRDEDMPLLQETARRRFIDIRIKK